MWGFLTYVNKGVEPLTSYVLSGYCEDVTVQSVRVKKLGFEGLLLTMQTVIGFGIFGRH